MTSWPTARLDPIRRLRVVAAATPNAAIGEVVVDLPYDEAWAWLMDHERTTPRFDTFVRKVRFKGRDRRGRMRMWVWVRGLPLVPLPFRVLIEDGFCLMQARARGFVVLMAAVPEGDGRTRYAHAEAIPIPGTGFLRRRLEREVASDLRRLQRNIGT